MCTFKYSSVNSLYQLHSFSSHIILLSKRPAIFFIDVFSLKVNMLFYIFPSSSTNSTWFSGMSLFVTLYKFTQVSSPLLFLCFYLLSLSFFGVSYLNWFQFGGNFSMFSHHPINSSVSCLWVLLSFSSFILFCSSMDFYLFLIGELWLFV